MKNEFSSNNKKKESLSFSMKIKETKSDIFISFVQINIDE